MDDDADFDDLFGRGPCLPGPDEPPGNPDFRATVVEDRVTVIQWNPLLAGGPLHRAVLQEREDAGVTIADLTVLGAGVDREVIVTFLARGGRARSGRALARWAATTGHRRIWFPERVVELEPPARFGSVATTCSNCGITYRESDPTFWANVREIGAFPSFCLVCGGDLPQWTSRTRR